MSGRGRGRPTVLEEHGLTKDDLIELYEQHRTIENVARVTGISVRSLKNYLRDVPKHTERRRRSNALERWIKEHPGERLPRNIKKLAEHTGISRRTVYYYLSKKRREYQSRIELEVMRYIRNHNVILDFKFRPIPTKAIDRIHVPEVKFFERRIPVFVELKNGGMRRITWEVTPSDRDRSSGN